MRRRGTNAVPLYRPVPQDKLFKSYIEMELQLGNIDRCRTLYQKYIEWSPANAGAWGRWGPWLWGEAPGGAWLGGWAAGWPALPCSGRL